MAMVVNNNIPALSTYNVINSTSNSLANSIKKLSTGLRINSAADDAAGLAISEKMRAQISGLDQAVSNSQDGISLIQTAEGALNETHSILQRMRELSVQAANDTLTQQDRSYIQEEVNQLREEITRIGDTTQFNKKKLLNGDAAVIWSSDNLDTKAIINGGLRSIDQFGQKSSAEGNYKITVEATGGKGEVQKTSLFRIKHELPQYEVAQTEHAGKALEASSAPVTNGPGPQTMTITVDGVSFDFTANKDYTDTTVAPNGITDLAADLQAAIRAADGSTTNDDATVFDGITVGVDNGALKVTDADGHIITFADKTGGTAGGVKAIMGVDSGDAAASNSTAASSAEVEFSASTGDLKKEGYTLTVKGKDYTFDASGISGTDKEAIATAIAAGLKTAAGLSNFTVEWDSSNEKATFKSTEVGFSISNANVTALVTAVDSTSSAITGAAPSTINYTTNSIPMDGKKFKISDGTTDVDIEIGSDAITPVDSVDKLVADLNNQLSAGGSLVRATKVKNDAGTEVVRLSAPSTATITIGAHSDTTDDSTDIFGATTTAKDGKLNADEAAKTLDSAKTYGFDVKDKDDNVLATVKLTGKTYEDTVDDATNGDGTYKVTTSAGQDLADEINTQLDGTGVKAVYKDGQIKLTSLKEFTVADNTTDAPDGGVALLLGGTAATQPAKENTTPDESTIGMTATSDTKLRDLEQFWDASGNFLLTDPQTLTITQGDGKQATITLYQDDTLGDVASKINDAISREVSKGGLGQGQYLDEKDDNYEVAKNKFASFVDNSKAGSEAVEGTMLIRSIVPGSAGTLSFSGSEDMINALGLNTIQDASETRYKVSIENAHTGDTVVEETEITGNRLVGALHPNVDVEFDAMAGMKAKWDGSTAFALTGSTDADGNDGYVTYLHLKDNTTVFQIGANEGEDMGINIGDMRSHALGLDAVNVMNRDSASRSITVIDNAIDKVSTQRAKLGAYQNRLEHTINNLTVASENLTSAESRIRDTDMAKEMMNFTKLQIMLQAGNSMLAQANQLPQNVLSLVR